MANTTNECREIYPFDSPLRQPIPDGAACKHCKNLGDLCGTMDREFKDTGTHRIVIRCSGAE